MRTLAICPDPPYNDIRTNERMLTMNNNQIHLALVRHFPNSARLCTVRRPSSREKEGFNASIRDRLFFIGDSTEYVFANPLQESDYHGRDADGELPTGSNRVWIISQSEWDALVALDQQRSAEKQRLERAERLEYLRTMQAEAERQPKIYADAEAAEMRRKYNETYNEGGEGFTPHYYTIGEYYGILQEIRELEKEDN